MGKKWGGFHWSAGTLDTRWQCHRNPLLDVSETTLLINSDRSEMCIYGSLLKRCLSIGIWSIIEREINKYMQRKIFKTGHSLAVTLSKKILEELDLKEGDVVEVLPEENRVIIKKSQKNTQLSMPFSSRPKLGNRVIK